LPKILLTLVQAAADGGAVTPCRHSTTPLPVAYSPQTEAL